MPRRVIKKLPSLGRGQRRFDVFDPNAIDADGDGLVQDATRFERPSAANRITAAMGGRTGRVRTREMIERDGRIVTAWKQGLSLQEIADNENTTTAAVTWVVNQARKRGLITEARRSEELPERNAEILRRYKEGQTPKQISEEMGLNRAKVNSVLVYARRRGELEKTRPNQQAQRTEISDPVLRLWSEGKSVDEITSLLGMKKRDVVQKLVELKQRGRLTGSMSTAKPDKTIQDYINNPQLQIDAETLARSIGFFTGSVFSEDEEQKADYRYKFHPQFGYDLKTGTPVQILGSRVDENADAIVKEGRYRIPKWRGNYGRAGNFGFDGDPTIGEIYSESLSYAGSGTELSRARRLITRLNLRNPLVLQYGVDDVGELTSRGATLDKIGSTNVDLPRSQRLPAAQEAAEEVIQQLGGKDKVLNLYESLKIELEEYGVAVDGLDMNFYPPDNNDSELQRYQDIIDGRIALEDHVVRDANLLARAAGHDGIVMLGLGRFDADTSQILVFDEKAIKVLGTRPAYSRETIDAWEDQREKTFRERIDKLGSALHWDVRHITSAQARLEELAERQSANPDNWTAEDDIALKRAANSILSQYALMQHKKTFMRSRNIPISEKDDKKIENALEMALAALGRKRRKPKSDSARKLTGSIRVPEPESWEKPDDEFYVIPFDGGDFDPDELPGGALYDEMIGPRQSNNRPNENRAVIEPSARRRISELISEGFIVEGRRPPRLENNRISPEIVNNIARDLEDDRLSIAEIAKLNGVGVGFIRYTFPELTLSPQRKKNRNDKIRADFLDGASMDELVAKYGLSLSHLRLNILSDLLQERGDREDAMQSYRDATSKLINRKKRRSRKAAKKTPSENSQQSSNDFPSKSSRISASMGRAAKSPLMTPGLITGSMANDNINVGQQVKSKIKWDGTRLDVDYGKLRISEDGLFDNYQRYMDAYGRWIQYDGNFGIRLASASLMGEPLPPAWGYGGNLNGMHHHDVIGTGLTDGVSNQAIVRARTAVADSAVMLDAINSGREASDTPLYRGLSNSAELKTLLGLTRDDTVTMPISAFTPNRGVANMYASNDGDGVIVELEPGAKIAYAAGEQYLHEFDILDDSGKSLGKTVDITEAVTAGKFKFIKMATILVPDNSGGTKTIKKITLEQVETFDVRAGKYAPNTGRLAGSMSSKRDEFLARVGDVRPITRGLIPDTEQRLHERGVENYVQRNPQLIQALARINRDDSWKNNPDAINPDGSQMTKEQYVAFKIAEVRQRAQEYVSGRLNKYNPDRNPNHLRQLQHNVDVMFAASPELQMLCETYGYPVYAIFKAQPVLNKDGKQVWVDNTEAHEKNMPGTGNGVTIMAAGISAIHPYSDDAFIPEGMSLGEAISDQRRMLNGHWGITPEAYGTGQDSDPMSMHVQLIDMHLDGYAKSGRRPDLTDANSPLGTLRHETSHAIHQGALTRALLDVLENPTDENRERYALLSILVKPNWQAAFSSAAGRTKLVHLMYTDAVSDYAASSPPEWLAETLSAALSPSRKTRGLLNYNHRAILALLFPELREYLVEGDWP